MSDALECLAVTVARRPYVFVALAVFLVASAAQIGKARTLAILMLGYGVAFASEWSSIRTGFPYGAYFYRYEALDPRELVVGGRSAVPGEPAGVPFFDSISYCFIAWASFATACALRGSIARHGGRRLDVRLAGSDAASPAVATVLAGAALFALLDVVVDPVAFRGDRWFLGRIYGYRVDGLYFHVPFSNTRGWLAVGLATLILVAAADRALARLGVAAPDPARAPGSALYGPILYFGLIAFQVTVAWAIGERLLALASLLVQGPLAGLLLARLASAAAPAPEPPR